MTKLKLVANGYTPTDKNVFHKSELRSEARVTLLMDEEVVVGLEYELEVTDKFKIDGVISNSTCTNVDGAIYEAIELIDKIMIDNK